MKTYLSLLALIVALVSCGKPQHESSHLAGSYVRGGLLSSRAVDVCWRAEENANAQARNMVKDFVTKEYGSVGITFRGWLDCRADQNDGNALIIAVADEQPFGNFGCKTSPTWCVRLNFDFDRWPGKCSASTTDWKKAWACNCTLSSHYDSCIQSYALHEFGHAVGLAHEADRPDSTCMQRKPRDSNVSDVGAYDPKSIMNYCNNQNQVEQRLTPTLSAGDIATIKQIYGI